MSITSAHKSFDSLILGAMRNIAFTIHEKIVDRTPIDTGRAKASWRLNPGSADGSVEPLFENKRNHVTGKIIEAAGADEHPLFAGQAAAVARAQQQKIPVGAQKIVISNNLDYIEKLENGTSQQAPGGMVAVTVTQDAVEQMFNDELVGPNPF